MGWYGNWELNYNGENNEKFVNLAKLIIPNYLKRFEETKKGTLECKRRLSWYNADIDISTIMEYLDESDTIHVLIDGETHPIREIISEGREFVREGIPCEEDYDWKRVDRTTGEVTYGFTTEYIEPEIDYYEYEEQTFRKENGKVIIDNEHPDEDRYIRENLGVEEILTYEVAYPENAKELGDEDVDTIDSYIKYIANEFSEKDDFIPVVQEFLYKIFDSQNIRKLTEEEYSFLSGRIIPDETVLSKIEEIRKQFETIESTKAYLAQVKMQNPKREEEESIQKSIPNFLANMSRKDVNTLGGMDVLLKLVELKGENAAKELLTMLGYKVNDNKVPETPSLEDLESEQIELKGKEKRAKNLHNKYKDQLPDKENDIIVEE